MNTEEIKKLFEEVYTNKLYNDPKKYYFAIQNLAGIFYDNIEDENLKIELENLRKYVKQLIKIDEMDNLRRLIPDNNLRGLFEPGFRNNEPLGNITINVPQNQFPDLLIEKIFDQYNKLDAINLDIIKIINWLHFEIQKLN